jgi:hypothetical protein
MPIVRFAWSPWLVEVRRGAPHVMSDGAQRPLGVLALEDKIVQGAVAEMLDDSADSALERGRALLGSEWHERVGAGERHIPAMRAPDGMLIYLVARDPS